tara:strand:+ start:1173 stop:1415 length:243 start_codon:yes stop_codon:yes gene_type:complete
LINGGNCSRVIQRPVGRFAAHIEPMEKILFTTKEVMSMTGLSRTSLYRYMDADSFPKSIKVGPNRIAWRRKDIDKWLNQM